MKTFSRSWISSKSRRKQHKYRYNAPLHIRQSFLAAHLTPELRKKYSKRSLQLRVGDSVKVMRGQFKKKTGKIESIDLKEGKAYITGVEQPKKDGSKSLYPVDPSNLQIQEIVMDDAKRKKFLKESKTEKKQESKISKTINTISNTTINTTK